VVCHNRDGKWPQPEFTETVATTARKKSAPLCPVCGQAMKLYENPTEWKCANTHTDINAANRQGGGTGAKNKGQSRPGSIASLGRLGRKRDKPS
jgi:hypothetical protein